MRNKSLEQKKRNSKQINKQTQNEQLTSPSRSRSTIDMDLEQKGRSLAGFHTRQQ